MKFIVFIISAVTLNAHALELTREISKQTNQIVVRVAHDSVRCDARGYGSSELKIDVKDLDWAASFNHRTFGEGQPCMTSGRCSPTSNPDTLLSQGEGDETVDLEVTHTEKAFIDETHNTCTRILQEDLKMTLRGKIFTHTRSGNLGETTAKACMALFKK
ncbi:MAG: hypothetical protein K2P81_02230 [Bacteriovoracaceae bacterium]|nr:hypothetical protein [Bacteriovoracaceae bacterium]